MDSLPSLPDPLPDGVPPEAAVEPLPAALEVDGRLHRLDPRFVPCSRLGGAIFAAVVLGVSALVLAYVALATDARPARLAFLLVLALVLVGLASLSAWYYPPLKLAHARWSLTPAALEIRSGVWFRHLISVPRARVQHTDVERGPLERRFELATLVVHTAGQQDSEVRLEGLRHEVALAIRAHLLASGSGDGA